MISESAEKKRLCNSLEATYSMPDKVIVVRCNPHRKHCHCQICPTISPRRQRTSAASLNDSQWLGTVKQSEAFGRWDERRGGVPRLYRCRLLLSTQNIHRNCPQRQSPRYITEHNEIARKRTHNMREWRYNVTIWHGWVSVDADNCMACMNNGTVLAVRREHRDLGACTHVGVER